MMIFISLSTVSVLILAELLIKSRVEDNIEKGSERKLFGNKVLLRKVYNKGLCFNLLEEEPEKAELIQMTATGTLTIMYLIGLLRKGTSFLKKIGLTLMTAGAWGNMLDRWIRGCVVDYIGVESKNKKLRDITANLSDIFLFAGAILVLFGNLGSRKRKASKTGKEK